MLGAIWTSPNTLLGLLLGFVSGAWPKANHRALNFYIRHGPVRWVCDYLGISAFTLGDCVLYLVPPTDHLRVHEGRHIQQYRALGPFFLPVYFVLLAAFGYPDHPLERDARDKERELLGCHGPSKLLE